MNFQIEITETLHRVVDVEADSLEDAIKQVTDDYYDEKIVLDSSDFIFSSIQEYKE